MEKFVIVDGHNLLFQMFFGMPNRIINSKGIAIQGVVGFVGAIKKIIEINNPDYLVVLFDAEQENSRKLIDDEYKSNRVDFSAVEDNLNPFSQLPYIYQALDYLKIQHFEVIGYECDDMIATLCHLFKNNYQIIISSYDTDFYQLLDDNVKIFRYKGKNSTFQDSQFLKEKYNIKPSSYAYFKSLTGDNADNIKGINNVGPKRASELVNTYSSIDELFLNIENIKLHQIKNSLRDQHERILNNMKLIELKPIPNYDFYIKKYVCPKIEEKTFEIIKSIGLY